MLRLALAISFLFCFAAAVPAQAPGPFRSVSFAILEDYDKGADLEDVARDFSAMKRLGITTWRGSFGWDDYEPEPGRYDFDWLVRFVHLAADSGIDLRPYLAYTPEWAGTGGGPDGEAWNDPPREADRFADFADTLARTLRRFPNVRSYEIYNEVWVEHGQARVRILPPAGTTRITMYDLSGKPARRTSTASFVQSVVAGTPLILEFEDR